MCICWGWIQDHVSSSKAKYRNTRCHFWTLWPKILKVYTLPAGNYSAVVCLANKPWKSPDPIHQVFTSACTRNVTVAFPDSNTRGLSWKSHLKSLMFPKEQRFDDCYKSFCLFQRYVIDSQREKRHKLISWNTQPALQPTLCKLPHPGRRLLGWYRCKCHTRTWATQTRKGNTSACVVAKLDRM